MTETNTLSGGDYIAKVRLSNKANETLAEAGETCERVPSESLPWLTKQHLVAPADKDALAAERKRKRKAKE